MVICTGQARHKVLETFGVGYKIAPEALKQALQSLFPKLDFHHWEMEKSDAVPEKAVLFAIFENESEFPLKIDLYGFPTRNVAEREQYIAKQLSTRLSCRTIVPYQEKGSTNPYYSVIFEKGKSYLANDCNTLFADGEGGAVKIIRPIRLKEYDFSEGGDTKTGQGN